MQFLEHFMSFIISLQPVPADLFVCEAPQKLPSPTQTVKKDHHWQQAASVFHSMLRNHGRTALISRQFLPKGRQRRTNLLLITLFCQWCSIILLFLAGWAPPRAEKASPVVEAQADGSIIVTSVDFIISNWVHFIETRSRRHTSRWMRRYCMHQHCTLSSLGRRCGT